MLGKERLHILRSADGVNLGGGTLKTELGQSSDRMDFRLNEPPVQIGIESLETVRRLRGMGLLGDIPHEVIVNKHQELAMDLDLRGRRLNLAQIAGMLQPLTLSDRKTSINFEDLIRTLDIYVVRDGISQRLRYYLGEEGVVQSSRIITAVGDGSSLVPWFLEDPRVAARQECVWVEREDAEDDERGVSERVKHFTEMFFRRHKDFGHVSALVYKKVIRGNFGEKTMWSHRRAKVIGKRGETIDAFATDAVMGMGDYLNFALQEVQKYSSMPLELSIVLPKVLEVARGVKTPEEFFRDLTNTEPLIQPIIRVEIECKGKHFQEVEGPLLTHELISFGQILAMNKIKFKIAQGRKIQTGPLKIVSTL